MRRQKLLICFLKGKMETAKPFARDHHTLKKLIPDTAACNAHVENRKKRRFLFVSYSTNGNVFEDRDVEVST